MSKLIREVRKMDRPREKADKYGVGILSNSELLALIIKTGTKNKSVLDLATDVLLKANCINNLSRLTKEDLIKIKGIKKAKALELLACFELYRRMSYEEALHRDVIDCPSALVCWLNHLIGYKLQENFLAIFLDTKNQIISYKILFQGTLDCSVVHPREIFKAAILASSSRIMLVHNHPSGNVEPSDNDLKMTKQLIHCGQLVGIEVLDHIIVGNPNYFSFKKAGLM